MVYDSEKARQSHLTIELDCEHLRLIPLDSHGRIHLRDFPAFSHLYKVRFSSNGAIPVGTLLDPEEVPEPYQTLLCHKDNMTSTLSEFFGGSRIDLKVLASSRDGANNLIRCILLEIGNERKPVELGAIRICLEVLPSNIQDLVVDGLRPLGAILKDFCVEQSCHPVAFFRIPRDEFLSELLGDGIAEDVEFFYGRINVIRIPSGQALAEVIEILPAIKST